MLTASQIHLVAVTFCALVVLTACGGTQVRGGSGKSNRLGPRNLARTIDLRGDQGAFRKVVGDGHPGISFHSPYGEIAITGMPVPLSAMVTFATDF